MFADLHISKIFSLVPFDAIPLAV